MPVYSFKDLFCLFVQLMPFAFSVLAVLTELEAPLELFFVFLRVVRNAVAPCALKLDKIIL